MGHIAKKHTKKFSVLLAALFITGFFASPLSAQPVTNWGGYIQSQTDAEIMPNLEFQEKAVSGFWFEADISDALKFYINASYTYNTTNASRTLFFNPDMAFAEGSIGFDGASEMEDGHSSLLRYKVGRFAFSEFTGYVLNHELDGLQMGYEHPNFSIEAGGGYTGLTFIPKSTIIVSKSDTLTIAGVREDGYSLASPKAIEVLKIRFPEIFLKQSIVLNGVLQQDLQKIVNGEQDAEVIHTEHAGIGINGPLFGSFYYNLFYYYNYAHGEYETSASFFGGGLRYYNKNFFYTRLSLNGFYSSGDEDQYSFYGGYGGSRRSSHFISLSSTPEKGIIFSPQIGNISMGEINMSMRPFSQMGNHILERFQAKLSAYTYFRNSKGVISNQSSINESSSRYYLGTEADLTLSFRPFSDLGVSFTGGFFFPNNYTKDTPLYDESGSNAVLEAAARLNVSFSY